MNIDYGAAEVAAIDAQRAWDECLISTWRTDGRMFHAINEWERVTGLSFVDHQSSMRRTPALGYPWKTRVRPFIANFLEKINARLWDQPQERDAAMIDKLQTSSYTTSRNNISNEADRELRNQQQRLRKSAAVVTLNAHNYGDRNRSTDWSVTKAPSVRVRRRG